jgi:hypothetical protein
MDLRRKIQVESLDDERMTNIERAVVAGAVDAMRARPKRRWMPALVVATTAIVAAAAVILIVDRQRTAPAPAVADKPLRVDGSRLDLGDAQIAIGAETTFDVTRPDGGVLVALERGKVELEVAPRKDRAPLIVRAGDVDVVVVGTRFAVERGTEVTVTVTEGVVSVRRGANQVRVAAGQQWSAPIAVAIDSPFPQPTAIIAAAPAGTTIATGEIRTTPDVKLPELRDRTATTPPKHDGGAKPRQADESNSKPETTPQPSGDGSGSVSSDLRGALRADKVKPPAIEPPDGEDPIKFYKLASGDSDFARAADALYGVAYTHYKAGNIGEALRFLDQLRQRLEMKKGPLLDDVLWLRVKLRCRTVGGAGCGTSAHDYAQTFPDTERAAIANQLANE